jgi:hypothetical protein
VGGGRFVARARTATPDEKRAPWGLMNAIWSDCDLYQSTTEREIPVVYSNGV